MNNCSIDLEGLFSCSFLLNNFIIWKSRNLTVNSIFQFMEKCCSFPSYYATYFFVLGLLFYLSAFNPFLLQISYPNRLLLTSRFSPDLPQSPELISLSPLIAANVPYQRSNMSGTWPIRTFSWLPNFGLWHTHPWSLKPKTPGSSLVHLSSAKPNPFILLFNYVFTMHGGNKAWVIFIHSI